MNNTLLKKIGAVTLVSILVAGIYLGYMFTIGIPKTQARNYYNKAIGEMGNNNKDAAKADFRSAPA